MKQAWVGTLTVLLCVATISAAAQSTRVFVYDLRQSYWDVLPGDSLSGIADALLPDKPEQHQRLMQNIVQLNPDAFINNDPARLKAYTRLWLPNTITRPMSRRPGNSGNAQIQRFNWGYIKKISP